MKCDGVHTAKEKNKQSKALERERERANDRDNEMSEKLYLNSYFLTFMMKLMAKHRLRRFSLKRNYLTTIVQFMCQYFICTKLWVWTQLTLLAGFFFGKFCAFPNDSVIFIAVCSQNHNFTSVTLLAHKTKDKVRTQQWQLSMHVHAKSLSLSLSRPLRSL